ncbi:MAG: DUF4258 domain-containing protein [Bacillota bacterium]
MLWVESGWNYETGIAEAGFNPRVWWYLLGLTPIDILVAKRARLSMDIVQIRECIREGKWRLSYHVLQRCDERGLEAADLAASVMEGDILEDYPDDPRGPSCLMLCRLSDGSFLHVVCGLDNDGWLVLITAYRPEEPKWIDEKTRRRV